MRTVLVIAQSLRRGAHGVWFESHHLKYGVFNKVKNIIIWSLNIVVNIPTKEITQTYENFDIYHFR